MDPTGLFFQPIPIDFWSDFLERPFECCVSCECDLAQASAYIVQKQMVRGEAVLEMAICQGCRHELSESFSEETRERIGRKLAEDAQRSASRQRSSEISGLRPEDLLQWFMNRCFLCGRARETCNRYSLTGLFRGQEIAVQYSPPSQSPVMVCEACEKEYVGLLSQKTRDTWDRFVEEFLGDPPGSEVDSPEDVSVFF